MGVREAGEMIERFTKRDRWREARQKRFNAEQWTGHGSTRRVEDYEAEADAAAAYIAVLEARRA